VVAVGATPVHVHGFRVIALEALVTGPLQYDVLCARLFKAGGLLPAKTINSLERTKCVDVEHDGTYRHAVTITAVGREALQKARDAKPWTVPYDRDRSTADRSVVPTVLVIETTTELDASIVAAMVAKLPETAPEGTSGVEDVPEAVPEAPTPPGPISAELLYVHDSIEVDTAGWDTRTVAKHPGVIAAMAKPVSANVGLQSTVYPQDEGCTCKPGDPCYFHFTRGKR
jgi:hypothetical protein